MSGQAFYGSKRGALASMACVLATVAALYIGGKVAPVPVLFSTSPMVYIVAIGALIVAFLGPSIAAHAVLPDHLADQAPRSAVAGIAAGVLALAAWALLLTPIAGTSTAAHGFAGVFAVAALVAAPVAYLLAVLGTKLRAA